MCVCVCMILQQSNRTLTLSKVPNKCTYINNNNRWEIAYTVTEALDCNLLNINKHRIRMAIGINEK